jgi:translocator protein
MDSLDWATLILFFHVTFWAGLSGANSAIKGTASQWYKSLKKAPWQPPALAFQVWNILYILIALAGWLALKTNQPSKWYYHASLAFWIIQLVTNALWTPTFFRLREPLLALVLLVLALVSSTTAAVLFFLYVKVAAYLFIPYIAWLVFALTLNAYIVIMNEYCGNDIKRTVNE